MPLHDVLGRTAAARFPVAVAARRTLLIATVASAFAITLAVDAHHSYSEYDDTKSVEVEGKLVDVAWQKPLDYDELVKTVERYVPRRGGQRPGRDASESGGAPVVKRGTDGGH